MCVRQGTVDWGNIEDLSADIEGLQALAFLVVPITVKFFNYLIIFLDIISVSI